MDSALEAREDELLEEIGTALFEEGLHAFPPSKAELRALALKWFDDNRTRLKATICSQDYFRNLEQSRERRLLFDALCEVLVHVTAGIPAGSVSSYLIQRGLSALCDDP